eukprot:s1625_g2.t2
MRLPPGTDIAYAAMLTESQGSLHREFHLWSGQQNLRSYTDDGYPPLLSCHDVPYGWTQCQGDVHGHIAGIRIGEAKNPGPCLLLSMSSSTGKAVALLDLHKYLSGSHDTLVVEKGRRDRSRDVNGSFLMPGVIASRLHILACLYLLALGQDHEDLCNGDLVGDSNDTMLCDEQDVKTCSQYYTVAGEETYLQCGVSGEYCLALGPVCKKASYGTVEIDGKVYERFWWYRLGSAFPESKADVLQDIFGTCEDEDEVCFQRLPSKVTENGLLLLAIDDLDNQLVWSFDPENPVAHAVFNALKHGTETHFINGAIWDPRVIKGSKTSNPQDTFMYRQQNGIRSFLLDDDGCDCHSTLSMGHGMCHNTCIERWSNCKILGGVDKLSDKADQIGLGGRCGPASDHGLTLYYHQLVPVPTCGGTSNGAVCRFPFYYKGKQYFQCTEADSVGKPWCYTTAGKIKWGNCRCNEVERRCHTFVNWRKKWLGSHVEIKLGDFAYGAQVGSWNTCLTLCERAKECKQVVYYNGHCYGMSQRSDDDQDGRGGQNIGFISAHCYDEGDYAVIPDKVCKGRPYTFDRKAKCDGFKGLTLEQCQKKCADSETAPNCPKKTCRGAAFYRKTGWCHLYEACTELADAGAATAIVEKVDTDCANVVQDIPEHQRRYSSVWANDRIGRGHATSMLGSLLAWCSRRNVAGQFMQIDLGLVATVVGVVTRGRITHSQWVTSYKVQTSVDGRRFIDAPGGTGGNWDQHSDQEVYFSFPVEARYIRIIVYTWHRHICMRASPILCQAVANCVFRIDDDMTSAWYNEKDMTKKVRGGLRGWRSTNRLSFELVPGAKLAVAGSDHNRDFRDRGGFWANCPGFLSKDNIATSWESYCTDGAPDAQHRQGGGSGWKPAVFNRGRHWSPGTLGDDAKKHCVFRAEPLPKEAASGEVKCIPFASQADTRRWAQKCRGIPAGVQYLKLQMGQVADYFKPDAGYSYCDMLVSSNKHLWSADGEVWEKPEYTPHGRHFGGSRWSWPRKTQARHGDSRLYLSHWGGPNGWLWGCCYDSYDGKPSWRRMFSLSYCGIGLKAKPPQPLGIKTQRSCRGTGGRLPTCGRHAGPPPMYVQYAGGGQLPYYQPATPQYQQPYGAISGGFAQPMQLATPQHYAAQPYTPAPAPAAYYQPTQSPYAAQVQQVPSVHQPQTQYHAAAVPDNAYAHAQVMQPMGHPAYLPGHAYVQKPETVQQHPSSVRMAPGAPLGPNRAGTNLTQAQPAEMDDEDDPNRLPTFVKIRET